VDLLQLEQQYRGKTLAALIEAHTRTMSREILIQAIRGTLIEFEIDLRPQMEKYAELYLQRWLQPELTHADLADLFTRSITDFKMMAEESGLVMDNKRLFDLFHVSVLKLALLAQTDASTRQLIRNP
jgi:hypothetical protein